MQHLLTPQFIHAVQEDAKVAAAKPKQRSRKKMTPQEKAAAKKKTQDRVLRNLVVDTGKSPSKRGTEGGASTPTKKQRLE